MYQCLSCDLWVILPQQCVWSVMSKDVLEYYSLDASADILYLVQLSPYLFITPKNCHKISILMTLFTVHNGHEMSPFKFLWPQIILKT